MLVNTRLSSSLTEHLLNLLQIIVCTLLILAGSILLTSGQIAYEEPGLPFGYYTIPFGKKITCCIQFFIVIFSPITLLFVRLQHQIVKKKWQRLQAGIYILQKKSEIRPKPKFKAEKLFHGIYFKIDHT